MTIPVCLPKNPDKVMAGDYSTLHLSGNAETFDDAIMQMKSAVTALKEVRKDLGSE